MSGTEIDAQEAIAERETEIAGARGPAALKGTRRASPAGARVLVIAIGVVMLAVMSLIVWKTKRVRSATQARAKAVEERVEKVVPGLTLAPPDLAPTDLTAGPGPGLAPREGAPGVESPVLVPRGNALSGQPDARSSDAASGTAAAPREKTDEELVLERRLSRGFGSLAGESGESGAATAPRNVALAGVPAPAPLGGGVPAATSAPQAPGAAAAARDSGRIDEKLEVPELHAASARLLPDRNYLLTQGAVLDCVLETRIVSTVSGFTSCYLTRDIYSTNGHVVLLDRGTRLVGRYQGGVAQGGARIFVVWTRAETPNGVIVSLNSPGTGALGEAGLGGWVDTHFWDRFGAAILLSVIEDAADATAARAGGAAAQPGSLTYNYEASATKDVVSKSMDPTINIPPTLYKNQGERVGIFVARDLDFGSVYGLASVARTER